MEIIDELEPTRRSLYTGAVGYFGRGGASGFNIAIRTMLVEGDRVSYQVGGGIVADSDPEAEYDETSHKGRGLREVLEGGGTARMIWVGGRIVPDDALTISVLDRTFEHGLGLFETFRTWNGHADAARPPPGPADALGRGAGPAARSVDQLPDAEAVAALLEADGRRRRRGAPDHADAAGSPSSARLDALDAAVAPARRRPGRRGRPSARAWPVDRDDPLAGHKTLNYWSQAAGLRGRPGPRASTRCLTIDAGRASSGRGAGRTSSSSSTASS